MQRRIQLGGVIQRESFRQLFSVDLALFPSVLCIVRVGYGGCFYTGMSFRCILHHCRS